MIARLAFLLLLLVLPRLAAAADIMAGTAVVMAGISIYLTATRHRAGVPKSTAVTF